MVLALLAPPPPPALTRLRPRRLRYCRCNSNQRRCRRGCPRPALTASSGHREARAVSLRARDPLGGKSPDAILGGLRQHVEVLFQRVQHVVRRSFLGDRRDPPQAEGDARYRGRVLREFLVDVVAQRLRLGQAVAQMLDEGAAKKLVDRLGQFVVVVRLELPQERRQPLGGLGRRERSACRVDDELQASGEVLAAVTPVRLLARCDRRATPASSGGRCCR